MGSTTAVMLAMYFARHSFFGLRKFFLGIYHAHFFSVPHHDLERSLEGTSYESRITSVFPQRRYVKGWYFRDRISRRRARSILGCCELSGRRVVFFLEFSRCNGSHYFRWKFSR